MIHSFNCFSTLLCPPHIFGYFWLKENQEMNMETENPQPTSGTQPVGGLVKTVNEITGLSIINEPLFYHADPPRVRSIYS